MISVKQSIPEILSYNPSLEMVFDRYDAWKTHQHVPLYRIDPQIFSDNDFLVEILRAFDNPQRFCPTRFLRFPIHTVLDYLYRTHRYYTQKRMLEIEQTIGQLAEAYGNGHPLLLLLHSFFPNYREHLEEHMALEEDTLFPYILDLGEKMEGVSSGDSIFSHYSLDEFLISHEEDHLDDQLREVHGLIKKKYPELKKIFMFKVLSAQLEAFEKDLFIHEQIEDHVLVAQARKLENKLK